MKPVTHAVAVAIPEDGVRRRVLSVRRPLDDPDLPGLWGLPAATLTQDEDWPAAVRRLGRQKLGVDLAAMSQLREGTLERAAYLLHMKLFEARITAGTPRVPQPTGGMTQYIDWSWTEADELVPAARRGSLCCRLYLRTEGRGWTG